VFLGGAKGVGCGGDIRNMGGGKRLGENKRETAGGFEWGAQWASRKSKRGRNMGGMLMGIRKTIMEKGTKIERGGGMIVGRVRQGKERWRIVGGICK